MAVSKVIVACVFIGILTGEISSQPIKRSTSEEFSEIFLLPKPFSESDMLDIYMEHHNNIKPFEIYLTENDGGKDKDIFQFNFVNEEHENNLLDLKNVDVPKRSYNFKEYFDGKYIKISFIIRKNANTDKTVLDICWTSACNNVDIDMADVKSFKVAGDEFKVKKLQFKYSTE